MSASLDYPVTLTNAEQSDVDYFFSLYRDALQHFFAATIGWNDAFRRAAFRFSYPVAHTQRICVGDAAVRVGALCVLSQEDGGLEVALLLVDPAWRGRGIGGAVLEDVCHRAKTTVRLSTFKANEAGARFYRRTGFDVIGEDDHYLHFHRTPTL